MRNIARLARIKVTDEEAKNLETELSAILTWVEQLGEVDTDTIAPLTSVVEMSMKKREDQVSDGDYADDIIANAPEVADHLFVVPKVVE